MEFIKRNEAQNFIKIIDALIYVCILLINTVWIIILLFLSNFFLDISSENLLMIGILFVITLGFLFSFHFTYKFSWFCITKIDNARSYFCLLFWPYGTKYGIRHLAERKHPITNCLISQNSEIYSTIDSLIINDSSKYFKTNNEAFLKVRNLVEKNRDTVIHTSGMLTPLRDIYYLKSVGKRPKDANPVILCGYLENVTNRKELFVALYVISNIEKNLKSTDLQFTPEHENIINFLLDNNQIAIFVFPEKYDQPQFGIFGEVLYLEQIHQHNSKKDIIIIEKPLQQFHNRISYNLEKLIESARRIL